MENYILKEQLTEALNNFYELNELKNCAAYTAAVSYVKSHAITIRELAEDKIARSYEDWIDEIIEDAIEEWLVNY